MRLDLIAAEMPNALEPPEIPDGEAVWRNEMLRKYVKRAPIYRPEGEVQPGLTSTNALITIRRARAKASARRVECESAQITKSEGPADARAIAAVREIVGAEIERSRKTRDAQRMRETECCNGMNADAPDSSLPSGSRT